MLTVADVTGSHEGDATVRFRRRQSTLPDF